MDFFSENALYIVMVIVLLTWGGIFSFLAVLDKRLKDLQREIKEN